MPVIAGTGSNSTAEAIRLTSFAREAGADGALLISPYYNKPTQEGIFKHYKMIAQSVDLPLIVYNIPGRTGSNIMPETMARLCEIRNIVGVKEASGSMDQVSDIHRLCGDRLDDSVGRRLADVAADGAGRQGRDLGHHQCACRARCVSWRRRRWRATTRGRASSITGCCR